MRELENQNEHEQEQYQNMRQIAEKERRETLTQEEGANRKLRSLEQEKKRLEEKHRQEQERGKSFENALGQIKN